MLAYFIVAVVRLNWIFLRLAIIPAIVLLGVGCSGINASRGFSPASFFLPGLIQNKPETEIFPLNLSPTEPAKDLAQTN